MYPKEGEAMQDYQKLYTVLAEAVDAFFALLGKEEAERAVELLMKARLSCLECEMGNDT